MAGTFQTGDVVKLRPPCELSVLWSQLAEQLEGATFQVTGTVTGEKIGTDVLVMEPWPGSEIFPGYRLVPAEYLQLASQEEAEPEPEPVPFGNCDDVCDTATDAIRCINARLQRLGRQLDSASRDELQLALEQALREAEVEPIDDEGEIWWEIVKPAATEAG